MPRIDAHQHFWIYDIETHGWISEDMKALRRDFMPVDLKEKLKGGYFGGCVAVQADQSEEETQFLLNLEDEYSFVRGVVGWLDIRAANFEERLEHWAGNPALKGVRHIVQDEPDEQFLLQPDFVEGMKLLADYDLTYDILIYEHQLSAAVKFVRHFPEQLFVLDHMAKPVMDEGPSHRWEEGIRSLAEHPQLHCKLSGLVTEADGQQWQAGDFKPYLDVVFDAFGADRLMFGSDWPICTVTVSYVEVVSIIEDYIDELPEEQQRAIMGGNACGFYNL